MTGGVVGLEVGRALKPNPIPNSNSCRVVVWQMLRGRRRVVGLGVGSEVKPNPIPNSNTCRVVV